ncbi:carbonyl reductase [NADPH] 1-like [Parasteatoda tepidariorum]|uniref:carbonyl reductase [NADPH] 1-like n=1 Tax=Parasteatoda tepidariorum TaxID=114398 RepID=UPI0039BCD8CE
MQWFDDKVIVRLVEKYAFIDNDCDILLLICAIFIYYRAAKAGKSVQKGWGESAYAVSKNGVTAVTFIQHHKFSQDPDMDIVINAVHPGYVDTDMTYHKGDLTPDQGAESSVYCALLPPGVESPRGEFIFEDKKINPWFPK